MSQKLHGTTLVDAGASNGIYSYWMSKLAGPNGRVVAFEPQPECVTYLNKAKEKFRLDNLQIIPKGLSSSSGGKVLARDKPGDLGASIEWIGNRDESEFEHLQIATTTLDEFFATSSAPSLIKCDVEGHELAVFTGGQKLLEQSHPTLLFECHHREATDGTLFRFLKELGYSGYFFESGKKYSVSECLEIPYERSKATFRNYVFQLL